MVIARTIQGGIEFTRPVGPLIGFATFADQRGKRGTIQEDSLATPASSDWELIERANFQTSVVACQTGGFGGGAGQHKPVERIFQRGRDGRT